MPKAMQKDDTRQSGPGLRVLRAVPWVCHRHRTRVMDSLLVKLTQGCVDRNRQSGLASAASDVDGNHVA